MIPAPSPHSTTVLIKGPSKGPWGLTDGSDEVCLLVSGSENLATSERQCSRQQCRFVSGVSSRD